MSQLNLLGEPAFRRDLGQWHTPPWLARKAARWLPPLCRVLEPSCGGGNLIEAALPYATRVVGIDLDLAWVARAAARFAQDGQVDVYGGNFLTDADELGQRHGPFGAVFMNPPFEDNAPMAFVLEAFKVAPVIVGVFPSAFEFGQERDAELWETRARVTHRARMPKRVHFGGDLHEYGGKTETVVLRLERRACPRSAGEQNCVIEEVWTP